MNEHEEQNNNGSGYLWIIVIIIIGGIIWWGVNHFQNQKRLKQQRPFWKGTELLQVCKMPYDSSDECHKLKVSLVNENNATIYFPNGGYKNVFDIECWLSARVIKNQPDYTFCRTWDSDGQQWDILPLHAYWPSSEDLDKYIDVQLDKIKN